MDIGSVIVATAALIVSMISFYFSVRSWRESNRALITVRTTSLGNGGNVGIPLSILVENTGNRPAKNIRLSIDEGALNAVLAADREDVLRKEVHRCFSERGKIPVLANGRSVLNGFGWLSDDGRATWTHGVELEVSVSYEDLDGRKYTNRIPLMIADDEGFAGSIWRKPEKLTG